ncbi:hypothetical protein ACQEU6_02650 [Spirillospora sp. CA-108201]
MFLARSYLRSSPPGADGGASRDRTLRATSEATDRDTILAVRPALPVGTRSPYPSARPARPAGSGKRRLGLLPRFGDLGKLGDLLAKHVDLPSQFTDVPLVPLRPLLCAFLLFLHTPTLPHGFGMPVAGFLGTPDHVVEDRPS